MFPVAHCRFTNFDWIHISNARDGCRKNKRKTREVIASGGWHSSTWYGGLVDDHMAAFFRVPKGFGSFQYWSAPRGKIPTVKTAWNWFKGNRRRGCQDNGIRRLGGLPWCVRTVRNREKLVDNRLDPTFPLQPGKDFPL